MKKAIYPGSFDPFHEGHLSIYKKAIKLFDEVIIYVTNNDDKTHHFSLEERKNKIKKAAPQCKVISDKKLTALIAKENEAFYIIRGLRTFNEIEYELTLASINKQLNKQLETVIIFSDKELEEVSSSKIREIQIKYEKDIKKIKE